MSRHRVALIIVAGLCLSACSQQSGTPPQATAPANTSPSPSTPSPDKLLKRISIPDGARDSTADMRLTVELPGGRRGVLEFRLQRKYSPDSVSTFLQVTAPREQTDQALLAIERPGKPTEATSYLAGLKKLAKLSSSSTLTFQETKVTVQELLALELGQYTSAEGERATEDSQAVVKYKLTAPAGRGLAFPQITAWFRESDMTPVKFELFDERGALQKTAKIEQVTEIEGHQTVMRSAIQDLPQNRTLSLETRAIKFNQGLNAELFTEEHLMAVINGASRRLLEGK